MLNTESFFLESLNWVVANNRLTSAARASDHQSNLKSINSHEFQEFYPNRQNPHGGKLTIKS